MRLNEDMDHFWRIFSDEQILADIKEATSQDWPACGGVSVARQMELLRQGKIRFRAQDSDYSHIICIDCEPSFEYYQIVPSEQKEKLCYYITIGTSPEIKAEFKVLPSKNQKEYTDYAFDHLGKHLSHGYR